MLEAFNLSFHSDVRQIFIRANWAVRHHPGGEVIQDIGSWMRGHVEASVGVEKVREVSIKGPGPLIP